MGFFLYLGSLARPLIPPVIETHDRTGNLLTWVSTEVKITPNFEYLVYDVESLSLGWQSGLNGDPQKGMSMSKFLKSVKVILQRGPCRLCLRIWRWDQPGLLGWALILITSVLRRNRRREGRKAGDNVTTERDWWDSVKECQALPQVGSSQERSLQKTCGPANALILDFWTPELWEITFLSF